jgi:hypothetical protein
MFMMQVVLHRALDHLRAGLTLPLLRVDRIAVDGEGVSHLNQKSSSAAIASGVRPAARAAAARARSPAWG